MERCKMGVKSNKDLDSIMEEYRKHIEQEERKFQREAMIGLLLTYAVLIIGIYRLITL